MISEIRKLSAVANKPVLPYIAVHLRDILFIELGNPRSGDVIDYEKVLLFGSALSKLCYFQRHQYSLSVDPMVRFSCFLCLWIDLLAIDCSLL